VAASLRSFGVAATLGGAAGSLGLLLFAGRTAPRPLLVLFALWILSPFAVLLLADRVSRRWPAAVQATLHRVMIGVALASPCSYAVAAFGPLAARPAPMFVTVPPVSWVLIAGALGIAALRCRSARSTAKLPPP